MALLLPACSRIYQKPAKYKELRELEKQFICIQTHVFIFLLLLIQVLCAYLKQTSGGFNVLKRRSDN